MDAAYAAFAGALGWALPFAAVGLVVVLVLSPSLRRLIDRMRSLTIGGNKAEMSEPQQQQVEQAPAEILPAAVPGRPELPPPPISPLEPIERDIRQRLQVTAPDDAQTQLAWAIRVAANTAMERDMEVTYRIIFGSQIAALKDANVRGGMITIQRAQEIYDQAKRRFPELYEARSFEEWADFILLRGLATRPAEPVGPGSTSHITENGKQFLHFMVAKGLSEDRYG